MNLQNLFNTVTMTAAVNKLPVAPGKLGEMGLFGELGVKDVAIAVDVNQGRLVLVPDTPRDAEGNFVKGDRRSLKTFRTLHLPLTGQLLPGDLQGVRAFGSAEAASAADQAKVINDKMASLKGSIEATREWQRVGAVRGKILNSDGKVIYDLFQEFGVAKKSITVKLSAEDTDVRKHCLDAKRHAEKKLSGVIVEGFRALCGEAFFDAFTSHKSVKEAFAHWQAAQDRLGGDMRSGFTFGGIEFIEYNAEVSGQPFIPADVAQVFPVAQGVFQMCNAPANYNEAVGTVGEPFYAKAEERKMGKGWDIEVQSNPLALCLFPEALVELKAE